MGFFVARSFQLLCFWNIVVGDVGGKPTIIISAFFCNNRYVVYLVILFPTFFFPTIDMLFISSFFQHYFFNKLVFGGRKSSGKKQPSETNSMNSNSSAACEGSPIGAFVFRNCGWNFVGF